MFNDVYGYDFDGDGFIDTPDRGSFFGYDFDGDGDIDSQDDFIGFMLHEQRQKEWSHQPVRKRRSASDSGNKLVLWGTLLVLLSCPVFVVLLSYPEGWVILAIGSLVMGFVGVIKGAQSLIQWFDKATTASKTGKRAGRPSKKRRLSVGGMTQWQSIIIVALSLAVVLVSCGLGAAIIWTATHPAARMAFP